MNLVLALEKSSDRPDAEVPEKTPRRRFTAKYKLDLLKKADACTESGELGALLPREGLYSSKLTTWRRQRDQGVLDAMSSKKRGRKKIEKNPLAKEVATLQGEVKRLRLKLKKAETIIAFQKKDIGDAGDLPGSGRREQLMSAATSLSQDVGKKPACGALGMPRATFYRHVDRTEAEDSGDACRPIPPWPSPNGRGRK